jgi:cell wall-associated NlpC family hydrolase
MRVISALAVAGLLQLLVACSSGPSVRPQAVFYPPLSGEQSSDIGIHALGLVGTPYRYGGNTPAGGFDCSGLIGYVYRSRAGLTPPRTVAELGGFGAPIQAGELRTGDLVIFGAGRPSHAGIYVGEGRFVHAPSSGGTVRLDRLSSVYWSRQPTAFRRP